MPRDFNHPFMPMKHFGERWSLDWISFKVEQAQGPRGSHERRRAGFWHFLGAPTAMKNLGRGHFLGTSLLLQLLQEISLAQRCGAAQQLEQGVIGSISYSTFRQLASST
jgi:hypothetical protein